VQAWREGGAGGGGWGVFMMRTKGRQSGHAPKDHVLTLREGWWWGVFDVMCVEGKDMTVKPAEQNQADRHETEVCVLRMIMRENSQ
jgi:hypothetical protein